MSRFLGLALAIVTLSAASTPTHGVTIEWVTVGDPGNTADDTGYGAVADSFQIMKFEFTNSQYADFLNAVDPTGTNPNSVYDTDMGDQRRGGIIFTSGAVNGSKYTVKSDRGDKPVNYVSWFDAARVANWLENGQGSGSTETGAYTLNNATSGNAPAVNSGASYFLPTEDQWYKAAYYKGGSTNAGYWDYATQSDTDPTKVTSDSTGNGSAGSTGNFANFDRGAVWDSQGGNVTTVGTNGGTSAYGAFDMSGNVREWNDLTGAGGALVGIRGGNWVGFAVDLSSSSRLTNDPTTVSAPSTNGFRLASLAAVPEPSTWAMGLVGTACAGWWMKRRRRAR
jgi:sulfatase modifying factor 1